jgi:NAD(P)H-hydrate epimerase
VSDPAPITKLPPRPADAHKGTFGTLLVIGGSCAGEERMLGAPVLAARAALRSGVGLARAMLPQPLALPALACLPSMTALAMPVSGSGELIAHECAAMLDHARDAADAIVIGPGLGNHASIEPLVLRTLQQSRAPVVVDADALNAMARIPDLARDLKASCVLTPHPGEFRRLADALNLDADPIAPAHRPAAAEALAQRVGCIVVLKGAGTIVTNGHDTWTCDAGHACLATGGTGDVLAGLLGGLLAQWRAMPRPASLGPTSLAPAPAHASAAPRPRVTPAANPAFADAPGLAPVMSTDQLMALAAAKLGKAAPAAAPATQAPSPAAAAPLTMLDVVKLGVLAHARAGEAWAKSRHASAGLLAEELADLIPQALEPLRA